MSKTRLYHSEKCLWHSLPGLYSLSLPAEGWMQPPSGAGFAESPESKRRIVSLLQVSSLRDKIDIVEAPMASEEDLLRVHTASYLEKFKAMSDEKGGELGIFAPFGKGSYEIAKLSAGLAKQALQDVIEGKCQNAYSISRPPGHHCLADMPMAFCLLANIAIAVEAVKEKYEAIHKVAIIDWDVHHGNGTQAIFYDRPDVLTISLHQNGCFPIGYSGEQDRGSGAGEGYTVNIPLTPGGGHEAYLYALEKIVVPKVNDFQPDLIVVACGLDALIVDPIARMMAHSGTYREMTKMLMNLAQQHCDGRLVMVHEGGYAESLVPFSAHAILEELSGEKSDVVDPSIEFCMGQQPNQEIVDFQKKSIDKLMEILG
ncbi:MAG: class II histone deacetylase [Bacteroidota bacterium]